VVSIYGNPLALFALFALFPYPVALFAVIFVSPATDCIDLVLVDHGIISDKKLGGGKERKAAGKKKDRNGRDKCKKERKKIIHRSNDSSRSSVFPGRSRSSLHISAHLLSPHLLSSLRYLFALLTTIPKHTNFFAVLVYKIPCTTCFQSNIFSLQDKNYGFLRTFLFQIHWLPHILGGTGTHLTFLVGQILC